MVGGLRGFCWWFTIGICPFCSLLSTLLSFHGGEVIDVDGLSRAIEGDDDGEADGDFGCGDGDDEENESLSVVVGEAIGHVGAGEGDEGEVGSGEHHLQTHEDDDDVAPDDDTGEADGKKDAGDEKVVVK